jgi:hypothetical protein
MDRNPSEDVFTRIPGLRVSIGKYVSRPFCSQRMSEPARKQGTGDTELKVVVPIILPVLSLKYNVFKPSLGIYDGTNTEYENVIV